MAHTDPTSEGIDAALLGFLRQKVNTFVKWDLVRFFHDNPHIVETAENIARFIGRDVIRIEHELNALVQAGVLESQDVSGVTIYRLVDNSAMRSIIDRFVLACDDRDFRVKVIYHVIRSMR